MLALCTETCLLHHYGAKNHPEMLVQVTAANLNSAVNQ